LNGRLPQLLTIDLLILLQLVVV